MRSKALILLYFLAGPDTTSSLQPHQYLALAKTHVAPTAWASSPVRPGHVEWPAGRRAKSVGETSRIAWSRLSARIRVHQRPSSLEDEKSRLASSRTRSGSRARTSDGFALDSRACGATSHSTSSHPDVGSPLDTPYGPRNSANTAERPAQGVPAGSSCHGGTI